MAKDCCRQKGSRTPCAVFSSVPKDFRKETIKASIEKRRISSTATQNSLESFHEVLKSGTLGDVVEQMHVGINKHQQASTSPTIDEGVLLKINAPCIA
jgi:hypothetical protein